MTHIRISKADHDRITQAVHAAERRSDAEIVTVVAPRSDAYHDVGLHYAIAAMLSLLALVAYRKRKQDQANGPIEGKSRRVEARKVNGTSRTSTARKTGTPRKPRSTTRSAES